MFQILSRILIRMDGKQPHKKVKVDEEKLRYLKEQLLLSVMKMIFRTVVKQKYFCVVKIKNMCFL